MVWYQAKKEVKEQSKTLERRWSTLSWKLSKHIKDKKVTGSIQHGFGDD